MAKEIPLRNGMVAIVDEEDFDLVKDSVWFATTNNGQLYYARRNGKPPFMHSLVMGQIPGKSLLIDHINGNGLDNRKANLRFITSQQNNMRRRRRFNSKSQYKGVSIVKSGGGQIHKAYIRDPNDRRLLNLGSFKTEEEAARQYDRAARALFGEFARTNFEVGQSMDILELEMIRNPAEYGVGGKGLVKKVKAALEKRTQKQ